MKTWHGALATRIYIRYEVYRQLNYISCFYFKVMFYLGVTKRGVIVYKNIGIPLFTFKKNLFSKLKSKQFDHPHLDTPGNDQSTEWSPECSSVSCMP